MKDAGMRIRVEPELRDQFVNLCKKNDVPAAQVLRSFMREFIHNNSDRPRKRSNQHLASAKLGVSKIATKLEF
jgi:hypothetical protein